MVNGSALYVGRLRHRRFHPTAHAFTYNLFMVLIEVDRVREAMAVSRLTSYNRFNWATFDERDHLGDASLPLRERVRQSALAHGHTLPDGPLYLLTHLRYLGYGFNPISFYFCFDRDSTLRLILAEVNSTFGEQHLYWIPVTGEATSVRHRTHKAMHVSPFNPMDLTYEFVVTPPGPSLVAHMTVSDLKPFFDATLTLERQPWDARHVRRVLMRHPLMTTKVILAIHWQALRLWWKGLRYHPHPLSPRERKAARQQP